MYYICMCVVYIYNYIYIYIYMCLYIYVYIYMCVYYLSSKKSWMKDIIGCYHQWEFQDPKLEVPSGKLTLNH